ncbi:MAG: GNAT family N-acetyltransferase [Myxococcota bacterium]
MIAIREAVRSDLDAVVEAVGRLNAVGHAADPRFEMVPDWRPRLRAYLADELFGRFVPFPFGWVATDDTDAVAGVVTGGIHPDAGILVTRPTARIDNLWVEPPHRRSGLGRRLVARFRERATAAGHPRLSVGTLAADARAVAFWRAVGVREQYLTFTSD